MAKFFLSARYRPNIWPFWVLCAFEFALTVALLALVGIASPNLYRTRLQLDGSENGFNSSPSAALYAAANYRSYKVPMVWSQFLTDYNLVIVVLSMFVLLVKATMYIVHVFPPIINCAVHIILIVLYAVGVAYQMSSDTSDPRRPQHGAPWYITKSCSVAKFQSNIGYCQQAKATFGCTAAMLAVFLTYFGFAAFSCFPSKQQKAEYEEKQRLKREKYGFLNSPEDHHDDKRFEADVYPEHAGIMNPMTPRTLAFNTLGGTKGLSMKSGKDKGKAPMFPLRSPGLPRASNGQAKSATTMEEEVELNSTNNPMYFPPPPKQSTRK